MPIDSPGVEPDVVEVGRLFRFYVQNARKMAYRPSAVSSAEGTEDRGRNQTRICPDLVLVSRQAAGDSSSGNP